MTEVRDLTPAQRAALAKKLAQRRAARSEGIPRREPGTDAPTSFSQELLWLLDQVGEGGWAYNAPETVRMRGRLDREALRGALDAVVARNEVLRTTYVLGADGIPVQRVGDPYRVALPVIDCEVIADPAVRLRAAARRLQREAERPFDLARDHALRALLVRLTDDDHLLLLNVHHIGIDGSSRAPLWRELSAAYNQLAGGATNVDLGPLPLQYGDYAAWQRATLGPVVERDLEYWRAQLTGAPELLELPTDRARPPVQRFHGAHRHQKPGADVLDAVKRLARQEGSTFFMAALAAVATYLHRISGEHDIVVGTPVANRNRVELEDVIGYFANTLALRTRFDGDPTFREVLRRARATVVDALAHQEVPFNRVVQELAPDRDPSRTPLFQVLLVVHTERPAVRKLAGLDVEPFVHERAWSKFDLTFGIGEHADHIGCGFEYSTDLWDESSIERMQRHFATLLTAALRDPDVPVSQLPLLDDVERTTLLDAWNARQVTRPDCGLHELVARAAAQTPDAVALDAGDERLTYRELVERADAVRAALVARNVAAGEPVGVAIGHEPALVVALLGVLRHGAVCLPLDPGYPAERLAHMVADAGARVVLASKPARDAVPDGPDVVVVDDIGPGTATGPVAPSHGDDPAYLVYTSGSTGVPKGVLLAHRGLVNHALGAIETYALDANDRVLQMCSPSFDISIEEIFPTLVAGGTVVFPSDDMPFGGRGFVRWLAERGVTVLDVPTAFWHEWVRDLDDTGLEPPATLRVLIVGGEKANAAAYARWVDRAGARVRWFNTYGPSEASVIATVFEPAAAGHAPDAAAELPIGTPIPNCPVYVLDPHGAPTPIGVPGELHIGGAGVALGYLHQPDLTAERFVDNTVDGRGGRLYRTGDLARWRADGVLEFVGRTDHQVKIRGFRVEPAEVAAALARHEAVAEATVVARDSERGKQLVGYVTCHDGAARVTGREVRRFAADTLPAYMTPSAVVVVDALPRTPNGKVDTDALPAPVLDAPVASAAEPRDDIERSLLARWRELLGTDELGVHDDFFEWGGHSLLAVRMFGAIEREHGRRLPLSALIQAPTVAQLAELLRRDAPVEADQLVVLRDGGGDVPIFFVHGPMGEGIIYLELVRRLSGDHPAYAFQDRGLDGSRPQFPSIEAMAAAYIDEMQRHQPHGPYVLAGFCMGGVVAYEMAHQLEQRGEDVALVLLIDAAPLGHLAGGRVYTTGGRIKSHVREFVELRGRARWDHTWETTVNVYDRIMRPHWWRVMRGRYLDHGKPLPRFFHDVEAVNWMLAGQYVAPHYRGRVVLLRKGGATEPAGDRYRREMWARLVADGEFGVHDIDSLAVSHMTLLKEPHVRVLAAAADDAIEAALGDARVPARS